MDDDRPVADTGAGTADQDGPQGPPRNPAGQADPGADAGDDAPPVTLTASQAKRVSSTARGMLIATGATVAVVAPVYLLNPQYTAETYRPDIDVRAIARQAADDAGYRPASPDLADWQANYARWVTGRSDGVDFWEVGFLTADTGFIQLTQTDDANPTWVAQRIGAAQVSGARTIGGLEWELLDAPDGDTVLKADVDGSTVILDGEAELADFDALAVATIEDIRQDGTEDTATEDTATEDTTQESADASVTDG